MLDGLSSISNWLVLIVVEHKGIENKIIDFSAMSLSIVRKVRQLYLVIGIIKFCEITKKTSVLSLNERILNK